MRTPWPDGGSHQCCTSPSTNCRAAARSRCSRVSRRLRHRERHHVLQLVAEAVGAARLVERRARPDPAGQRLVEQPAVQQDVHRPIRRLHLHRAEDVVPVLGHRAQDRVEIGAAVARRPRPAPRLASPPRRGRRRSRPRRSARARSAPAARRRDRDRRRRGWRAAPGQPARPGDRACRCGRGTPSGRPSRTPAGRRGRRTPRDRRTRCSRGCARASRRCPDRSRSRRTAPRRRGRCRAPTPRRR